MDAIAPMHIVLVLLVVVLLFGGKKIPELMKGIGQGMQEFKKASRLEDEPEKREPGSDIRNYDLCRWH
jgi:sec-independent protein translocase protein TatA